MFCDNADENCLITVKIQFDKSAKSWFINKDKFSREYLWINLPILGRNVMTTLANQQLIAESIWYSLAKITRESECHCHCGETFSSLAHYIGKKTGSLSQTCCPSCGSHAMAYVLPQILERSIPALNFQQEEKRKKFKQRNKIQFIG